jgi:hypothetical protein
MAKMAHDLTLVKWVLPLDELRFQKVRHPRFHHLSLKGLAAAEVHRAACLLRVTRGYTGLHSGSPAFRRPSISSFAFDFPVRAIHPVIVKVGSNSSTRAAASRASASRPRWAIAAARQP